MKISKKAAEEIANLYNGITVANDMIDSVASNPLPQVRALHAWRSRLYTNVIALRALGVSPIGYRTYNDETLARLTAEAHAAFALVDKMTADEYNAERVRAGKALS